MGIAVFFGCLVLVATRPSVYRALRRPVVRQAMVDTFYIRLFAIVVFPIALINDVVCGAISVNVAHLLLGPSGDVIESMTATLIEGVLLTAELSFVAWIAFEQRRQSGYSFIPEGICLGCGYSLRGCVSDRCPECGMSIERTKPNAAKPAETPSAAPAQDPTYLA